MDRSSDQSLVLSVLVVGLLEQEIRGQLLVLVAGEVGLDGEVALEAEAAKLFFVSTPNHSKMQGKKDSPSQ